MADAQTFCILPLMQASILPRFFLFLSCFHFFFFLLSFLLYFFKFFSHVNLSIFLCKIVFCFFDFLKGILLKPFGRLKKPQLVGKKAKKRYLHYKSRRRIKSDVNVCRRTIAQCESALSLIYLEIKTIPRKRSVLFIRSTKILRHIKKASLSPTILN